MLNCLTGPQKEENRMLTVIAEICLKSGRRYAVLQVMES
ncbi:hypothetical protein BN439_0662 [Erwinia amylovora Ea644]|nr:hypothetical protein BN439_0662 [Erwinia amylovora Ea644]CCP05759.1 hypothetical protein BN440_0708 [Erwinia amylovora MR1]